MAEPNYVNALTQQGLLTILFKRKLTWLQTRPPRLLPQQRKCAYGVLLSSPVEPLDGHCSFQHCVFSQPGPQIDLKVTASKYTTSRNQSNNE